MYEHTPSRNLCYSPLPARYFVRNDGLLNTQPAGIMLRARDQAWWNLLWLLFPQLDDALRVTCRHSAEWFHSRRRNEDWKFFRAVRRLLWDSELAAPSGLKDPLNHTPATEFVRAHGKAVAGKAEALGQTPRALLRTMTQRAELSDHGKVALC